MKLIQIIQMLGTFSSLLLWSQTFSIRIEELPLDWKSTLHMLQKHIRVFELQSQNIVIFSI